MDAGGNVAKVVGVTLIEGSLSLVADPDLVTCLVALLK